MITNWISNLSQDTPEFWKKYLEEYENATEAKQVRYVVFDCDTTGLDPEKDVLLSIGIVVIENDRIVVKEALEFYINQEDFPDKSATKYSVYAPFENEKISQEEAVMRFVGVLKNAVIVSHNMDLSWQIIHRVLKDLNGRKLKNERIDTQAMYKRLLGNSSLKNNLTSLDELCEEFFIPKNVRHTALGDAYVTALLFLKLKMKVDL